MQCRRAALAALAALAVFAVTQANPVGGQQWPCNANAAQNSPEVLQLLRKTGNAFRQVGDILLKKTGSEAAGPCVAAGAAYPGPQAPQQAAQAPLYGVYPPPQHPFYPYYPMHAYPSAPGVPQVYPVAPPMQYAPPQGLYPMPGTAPAGPAGPACRHSQAGLSDQLETLANEYEEAAKCECGCGNVEVNMRQGPSKSNDIIVEVSLGDLTQTDEDKVVSETNSEKKTVNILNVSEASEGEEVGVETTKVVSSSASLEEKTVEQTDETHNIQVVESINLQPQTSPLQVEVYDNTVAAVEQVIQNTVEVKSETDKTKTIETNNGEIVINVKNYEESYPKVHEQQMAEYCQDDVVDQSQAVHTQHASHGYEEKVEVVEVKEERLEELKKEASVVSEMVETVDIEHQEGQNDQVVQQHSQYSNSQPRGQDVKIKVVDVESRQQGQGVQTDTGDAQSFDYEYEYVDEAPGPDCMDKDVAEVKQYFEHSSSDASKTFVPKYDDKHAEKEGHLHEGEHVLAEHPHPVENVQVVVQGSAGESYAEGLHTHTASVSSSKTTSITSSEVRGQAYGEGGHSHSEDGQSYGHRDHAHQEGGHSCTEGGHSHAEGGHSYTEGAHSHLEGGHSYSNGGHSKSGYSHSQQGVLHHKQHAVQAPAPHEVPCEAFYGLPKPGSRQLPPIASLYKASPSNQATSYAAPAVHQQQREYYQSAAQPQPAYPSYAVASHNADDDDEVECACNGLPGPRPAESAPTYGTAARAQGYAAHAAPQSRTVETHRTTVSQYQASQPERGYAQSVRTHAYGQGQKSVGHIERIQGQHAHQHAHQHANQHAHQNVHQHAHEEHDYGHGHTQTRVDEYPQTRVDEYPQTRVDEYPQARGHVHAHGQANSYSQQQGYSSQQRNDLQQSYSSRQASQQVGAAQRLGVSHSRVSSQQGGLGGQRQWSEPQLRRPHGAAQSAGLAASRSFQSYQGERQASSVGSAPAAKKETVSLKPAQYPPYYFTAHSDSLYAPAIVTAGKSSGASKVLAKPAEAKVVDVAEIVPQRYQSGVDIKPQPVQFEVAPAFGGMVAPAEEHEHEVEVVEEAAPASFGGKVSSFGGKVSSFGGKASSFGGKASSFGKPATQHFADEHPVDVVEVEGPTRFNLGPTASEHSFRLPAAFRDGGDHGEDEGAQGAGWQSLHAAVVADGLDGAVNEIHGVHNHHTSPLAVVMA